MALKALMLRKKIDVANKSLEAVIAKAEELEKREKELETAINETETEEERNAVEEMIASFEEDKKANEAEKTEIEETVRGLEAELAEEEAKQEETPVAEAEAKPDAPVDTEKSERGEKTNMNKRFFRMSAVERDAFFAREDVKNYLNEFRSCIREKRAVTNAGLTIPEVFLGVLRENIMDYSKLYKHVFVRPVGGEARVAIMGNIPEAIWTDCCANLNELDLTFYGEDFACWKLGGYFAICNATLEDSDIDLASELLTALGQAIGLGLDKAILYGTGIKMPLGVVTRLVQTEQPADYSAIARPWVDLHTSNIKSIAASVKDKDLIAEIVRASGSAKNKYSRGEKVWVMNETTYTELLANTVAVTAAGTIVSGVVDRMPVVGGIIEVLNFVPDNVIIGGYFDLYTLVERAGTKFATSEHVRFIQDQTVFKGTGRYDGKPIIAEGFVAIGLKGVTPNATMSFAQDTANS